MFFYRQPLRLVCILGLRTGQKHVGDGAIRIPVVLEAAMKKIPTLFMRGRDHRGNFKGILPVVTPGLEWVLEGEGTAAVKLDGACCALISYPDGKPLELYRRYDANPEKGRHVPDGALKCQEEPDPITGHFPCWVRCSEDNPADKWFLDAFRNRLSLNPMRPMQRNADYPYVCYTAEAIGLHFNGNPYRLSVDAIIPHPHQNELLEAVDRSYGGIRDFLSQYSVEGIVFWKDGAPECKIKRSDFGLEWPLPENSQEELRSLAFHPAIVNCG